MGAVMRHPCSYPSLPDQTAITACTDTWTVVNVVKS